MTRSERQRRFPRGSRVRTTSRGATFIGRPCTGVVHGHGRKGDWLLILPDGAKSIRAVSTQFWEIDPTQPTRSPLTAGAFIEEHW